MLGFALPQFGASADEDLAEFAGAAEQLRAVGRLADSGFTDVFVDLLYVARGIDERLDWVQRVLEKT